MSPGEGDAVAIAILLVTFLLSTLGIRLIPAFVLAIVLVAGSFAIACASICTR